VVPGSFQESRFSAGIALLAILGASLAAEVLARWWIRRGRYHVFRPGLRERLYLHRPTHPQMEPVVRRLVNELGERGRPVPRRGRIFRVVVAGGSVVESYTLDQDTQWPAVIEAGLRTPGALGVLGADDAHVGNIGRSGVDGLTLELVLARVLPNYPRLDLIVIMTGAGDVVRWMAEGAPPDRPASPLPERVLFAARPNIELGWSPATWGLAELIRRTRARFWTTYRDAVSWMGRARRDRANATEIRHEAPGNGIMLDAFRQRLRDAVRVAARHADRVLLVDHPLFDKDTYTAVEEALMWNGGVGQAYRESQTVFYSTQVLCALMREVEAITREVAAEERVEHLAMRGIISPDADNFIDHIHLTPAGSVRVGQAIAAAVLSGAPGGTPSGDPPR